MEDLPNKMSPEDFKKFTYDGYFTIKRSDRLWSGMLTNIWIEQVSVRDFKAIGGTHGHGITDSTLQRWVLSAQVCVEIFETL